MVNYFKKVKGLILSTLILFSGSLNATTYYVAKSGSDSNDGSAGAPFASVQHAANTATSGDTVVVGDGTYYEEIETASAGVTFLSSNSWQAHVYQFRLKHTNTTLSGFEIGGASDLDNAHVRIEPPGTFNGSGATITNCLIADTPFLISTNADFGSDYIHVTDGNFSTAGFTNGSLVYLGGDSLNYYTNIGSSKTVQSISGDGATMYFTTSLTADPGSGYWAVVICGIDNSGFKGILEAKSAGAASNVTIVANTFSNLIGPAIKIEGNNTVIRSNTFTHLHGQYTMQLNGSDCLVENNLIISNKNIEWFTQAELVPGDLHPVGGQYYDWQCNLTASFSNTVAVTNITLRKNWFQDCDNQLSMYEADLYSSNIVVQSNVFVGMMSHGSFSRNDITFDHNTFFRCAYSIDENVVLPAGGVKTLYMTNFIVRSNVFVDYGEHANPANEYPYSLVQYYNQTFTNNYTVQAETMNYAASSMTGSVTKTTSPQFINQWNPLGADGVPFTDDDGLRPMPYSQIALLSLGALAPTTYSTTPVLTFRVTYPTNWQDSTGTNYNTNWADLLPHQRGNVIRPWNTPEAVGHVPAKTTFMAEESISAIDEADKAIHGIRFWNWDFGDGSAVVQTPNPTVTHTFVTEGTNTVILTVTNRNGIVASRTNTYRVLPPTGNVYYVATDGSDGGTGASGDEWRTIQHAADSVSAGDTVVVTAGDYEEDVDCTVSGASDSNPITFVSLGASTERVQFRQPGYVWEGFKMTNTITSSYDGSIYFYEDCDNSVARNCVIIGVTNRTHIIYCAVPASQTPENGQTNLVIEGNYMNENKGIQIDISGKGHTIYNNIVKNTTGEGDFVRPWGQDHYIGWNYCTNLTEDGSGGHADFIQSFGPDGYCKDIIVEKNVDIGDGVHIAQVCQFEMNKDAGPLTNGAYWTNIIFRNNIFAKIAAAANVDMNGTKWYNNLFYQVNTYPGYQNHVFAMGGTKGDAYGTEWYNNAFIECGFESPSGTGWYPQVGDVANNWDFTADYNFVCTTNGVARDDFTTETHGINGVGAKIIGIFNTNAPYDWRITTNSVMYQAGTDLSSLFTNDLVDDTRTVWNIGPLETVAYLASSSPQVYIILRGGTIGGITISE